MVVMNVTVEGTCGFMGRLSYRTEGNKKPRPRLLLVLQYYSYSYEYIDCALSSRTVDYRRAIIVYYHNLSPKRRSCHSLFISEYNWHDNRLPCFILEPRAQYSTRAYGDDDDDDGDIRARGDDCDSHEEAAGRARSVGRGGGKAGGGGVLLLLPVKDTSSRVPTTAGARQLPRA